MLLPLIHRVAGSLQVAGAPAALIGAGAMSVRGVARGTAVLDLLSHGAPVLEDATWRALTASGVVVDVRRGDTFDPLAGVVRVHDAEEQVDVVVGWWRWMERISRQAPVATVLGQPLPVATAADLVLLKLYAGGSRDRWDIEALLAADDGDALRAEVDARVAELGDDAVALWARLR